NPLQILIAAVIAEMRLMNPPDIARLVMKSTCLVPDSTWPIHGPRTQHWISVTYEVADGSGIWEHPPNPALHLTQSGKFGRDPSANRAFPASLPKIAISRGFQASRHAVFSVAVFVPRLPKKAILLSHLLVDCRFHKQKSTTELLK